MERDYIMIRTLAIVLSFLSGNVLYAFAGPSIAQVEAALHLWPGGKTTINIGGQPIQITYIGIEPRHGHEYAIIVEAR